MGSIHTHVSNFIDTWTGWANVIAGVPAIVNFAKSIIDVAKIGILDEFLSSALSSK
ncbi:hypothetical protein FRC0119_01993 [Corynebacterium diphtheriae]|nr:hypothetical protein FRC0026_01955 [Corynebacterium diphtheriae]CAB0759911.1 hypothetical protein FRC0119_01993 [Corynebacterium diphtheriae]CAB0814043.1 hypothetical protein FRC0201_01969 [Corynebacterium diphtheriae]CAB0885923.1 hypothetical protein FRC0402_01934 [Corynebacterium diphtheriae]CAB0978482.1 hypothetical protein FRC0482_01998 [Corynebacterium diphtheriae]